MPVITRHPPLVHSQRGFSLLEMAVVLVIVGFLLGGLLGSAGTMRDRQREDDTQAQLEEIRDALITFAVVNRRLPCPANPATADTVLGAGLERTPIVTGCTGGAVGVVPWATLGIAQTDAWGRRFTYRVTPAFSRSGVAISLITTGDATIRNRGLIAMASQVPAVIVAHGKNAAGSRNRAGALSAAGTNAYELENSNGDAIFIDDTPSNGYDDMVSWLPSTILLGRLLQSGILP
jgi:prepilin-type N-terminal cleavage/methylation domain-containing protein